MAFIQTMINSFLSLIDLLKLICSTRNPKVKLDSIDYAFFNDAP